MKYLYPLAAVLLLVSCKKTEEQETLDRSTTDWSYYKLNGDVKSVKVTSNEIINQDLEPGQTKFENPSEHDTEMQFSEDGMLIMEKKNNLQGGPFEQTKYNGRELKAEQIQFVNNEPGIKTTFDYDETGKNNTQIARRNPDNSQIDRKEMKYEKGLLMEKISYNQVDNPIDKVTYIYDDHGNLKGENLYLGTEYIQIKNSYEYNNKNQKIAERRYDKDENVIYTVNYQYSGDKMTFREVKNKNGEIEFSEKLNYDGDGNLLKKVSYDGYEKSETEVSNTYDAKGNKLTYSVTKDGQLTMSVHYTYDDKNNLVETAIQDGAGNPIDNRKYEYTFDDKGNWIKKIVFINGKPQFIEKREISYY